MLISVFLCACVFVFASLAFEDLIERRDTVPLWAHYVDESVDATTVIRVRPWHPPMVRTDYFRD